MTRSQREVDLVRHLIAAGCRDTEISTLTGIPRRTVLDWRHGRRPTSAGWPCSFEQHLPLPEWQYAYLLGLYLGDGCLSATHRTDVWRLRIFMDSRYPMIIDECCSALESIFPRQKAHRLQRRDSRCIEVSMYSKHWLCLIPQHGPGRKHLREITLAAWQQRIVERCREPFIKGLIHSDGCRIVACERKAGRVRNAARYLASAGLVLARRKLRSIDSSPSRGWMRSSAPKRDLRTAAGPEPSHTWKPICKVRPCPSTAR
jgi:hypothetical protein